jgi:D-inositol-3-phosphate glycosyltransferase
MIRTGVLEPMLERNFQFCESVTGLNQGGNMKVLLVNTGIFPVPPERGGGIETHTYNLARALSEIGCEVHYVTDVTSKAKFNKNVTTYRTYTPRMSFQAGFNQWVLSHIIGGVSSFRTFLWLLVRKRLNFDVVHLHGNLSGLLASIVNQQFPLVFTVHNPTPWMCTYESSFEQKFREVVYRLIDANVLRKVDHIIAVSQSLKDEIVSKWSIPSAKVSVIPNGVDTDIFSPNTSRVVNVRTKYRIEGRYCLFVGQLRSRKGVEYLLKAFSGITDKLIKCVIVGDGPEQGKLVKLVDDLKLSSRVVFTGAVPFEDLTGLYAEADFFVLPTVAEGSPLVVLEALASGLPTISTKVSGIPEVVQDECNGFIVPPRDVLALENRMNLLIEDRGLRKRMSENARKKTVETLSWRAVAKKTLSVYKKAIEDNS